MLRISYKSSLPDFNSQLVEDFDQQTKKQDCLQETTADFAVKKALTSININFTVKSSCSRKDV